jgi:hypothetical protein
MVCALTGELSVISLEAQSSSPTESSILSGSALAHPTETTLI